MGGLVVSFGVSTPKATPPSKNTSSTFRTDPMAPTRGEVGTTRT